MVTTVGSKVVANYKGKGNWYPGEITRDRRDGTFDIAYDDGEPESRVDELLIRIVGGASGLLASSSSGRNQGMEDRMDDFRENSKVEADYRGKGKYYAGRITRVRLNGTCDIDYDDGEKEMNVPRALIRSQAPSSSSCSSSSSGCGADLDLHFINDMVEIRLNDRGTEWVQGTILRVEANDNYTVELENGKIKKYVSSCDIRPLASKRGSVSDRRTNYLDNKFEKERTSTRYDSSLYQKGARVACYWYRISSLGAPKSNKSPKEGIVLCYNSDSTYTVELEADGSVIDDVAENHLKSWNDSKAARESNITSKSRLSDSKNSPFFDKWQAVMEMGRDLKNTGKIKHTIPHSIPSIDDRYDIRGKLNEIIGKDCVREFEEIFEGRDLHGDGEINYGQVLKAFNDLNKITNENDLKKWAKKIGKDGKTQKLFDFFDFVLAYANIFYPSTIKENFVKNENQEFIGVRKPLNIQENVLKPPEGFMKSFGKKEILVIENVFDTYANRNRDGVLTMRNNMILEVFEKLDRAVTKSKIQQWLDDNTKSTQDDITLTEFQNMYTHFFAIDLHKDTEHSMGYGGVRTICEVSVQVLQEERWRGSVDQTNAFIRRLSSGRTQSCVECIMRLRDAFEAFDTRNQGEVSCSDTAAVLKQAQLTGPGTAQSVTAFKLKLDRQSRGTFALPELYEHFGLDIQELSNASVSVSAAFSMLKMTLTATDVRAAADLVLRIIDSLLQHPNDPKYWQVNIRNEVRFILLGAFRRYNKCILLRDTDYVKKCILTLLNSHSLILQFLLDFSFCRSFIFHFYYNFPRTSTINYGDMMEEKHSCGLLDLVIQQTTIQPKKMLLAAILKALSHSLPYHLIS